MAMKVKVYYIASNFNILYYGDRGIPYVRRLKSKYENLVYIRAASSM